MDQLFSSGLEVANLVVSSGLLRISWAKICDCYGEVNQNEQQNMGFSLNWKFYQEAKFNIIAFITSPICTKSYLQDAELVSSTALKETFPLFEFLSSNGSSFSIHKATIALFAAYFKGLEQLKNQCEMSSNPLIVTGHALGGSIASLFTLWLVESLNISTTKRPLCLTFGSPLLGDKGFQQAISKHQAWNSCFLHVAANKDSIPRPFTNSHCLPNMSLTTQPNNYMPFGTFLLCCEIGCTCSVNPEVISELLAAMRLGGAANEENLIVDYGKIVDQLESMIMCKGISQLSYLMPNSFWAGISQLSYLMADTFWAGTALQLEAVGLQKAQNQQQQSNDFDNLIRKLVKSEETCILNKRKNFDPAKKLNEIKIHMAYLEWYKKVAKAKGIGYYDCYKNRFSQGDMGIIMHKRKLTNYWKEMVAQIEKKPQKELVYFRTRWLYAGTSYRRMIEPLDIADYYKTGQKNYITNGRSHHYIKLEQWLEEAEKQSGSSVDTKKQNVNVILTDDSCFWAHVEEARLWCKSFENAQVNITERGSLRQKLISDFEEYVMEQIKKYAVSSEVFLEGSSFMQWWKEYEKIIEPSHYSPLTDFMKNCRYHQYDSGRLVFY